MSCTTWIELDTFSVPLPLAFMLPSSLSLSLALMTTLPSFMLTLAHQATDGPSLVFLTTFQIVALLSMFEEEKEKQECED